MKRFLDILFNPRSVMLSLSKYSLTSLRIEQSGMRQSTRPWNVESILLGLLFLVSSSVVNAQTYTVTSTADAGAGSLRDAIDQVNTGSFDRVDFNISPGSVIPDTIKVQSRLPEITNSVTIDGTTESGFSPINGPQVILKFDSIINVVYALHTFDALELYAGDVLLKGLGFVNFYNGVAASSSVDHVTIVDCGFKDNVAGVYLESKAARISDSKFSGIIGVTTPISNYGTSALYYDGDSIEILNVQIDTNALGSYVLDDHRQNFELANVFVQADYALFDGLVFFENYCSEQSCFTNNFIFRNIQELNIRNSDIVGAPRTEGAPIAMMLFESVLGGDISDNNFVYDLSADFFEIDTDSKELSFSKNSFVSSSVANEVITLVGNGNNTKSSPSSFWASSYNAISVSIQGSSSANDTIEVYRNYGDQSTYNLNYVGYAVADGSGVWTYTVNAPDYSTDSTDNVFYFTATDTDGNTSEFSEPFTVDLNCTVTNTDDAGSGSLRQAINNANSGFCTLIDFDISPASNDPDSIVLTNNLPALRAEGLMIDGRTESGYAFGFPSVCVTSVAGATGAFQIEHNNIKIYGLGIHAFSNIGVFLGSSDSPNQRDAEVKYCTFTSNGTGLVSSKPTGNPDRESLLVDSNFFGMNGAREAFPNTNSDIVVVGLGSDSSIISNNIIGYGNLPITFNGVTNGKILNNMIGTDLTGADYSYNNSAVVLNSDNVLLDGNIIRGYASNLTLIVSGSSNIFTNNFIGQTPSGIDIGSVAPPFLALQGSNNIVGLPEQGNTIANSLNGGVYVQSGTGNIIRYNTFTNNLDGGGNGIGIVLAGGNNSQPQPIILSHTPSGNSVELSGTAQDGDTIHFYLGDGEPDNASTYVGNTVVSGGTAWTFTVPDAFYDGIGNNFYIATATDGSGNTSQFSDVYSIVNKALECVVTNTDDYNGGSTISGSLRACVQWANTQTDSVRITFDIPGDGPHVIESLIPYNITDVDLSIVGSSDSIVIDGSLNSAGGGFLKQFSAQNKLLYKNLTVRNMSLYGFTDSGTGLDSIAYDNCNVYNCPTGIYTSGGVFSITNCFIGNASLRALALIGTTSSGLVEGCYIGLDRDYRAYPITSADAVFVNTSNVIIRGNVLSNFSSLGIRLIAAKYNRIESNYFNITPDNTPLNPSGTDAIHLREISDSNWVGSVGYSNVFNGVVNGVNVSCGSPGSTAQYVKISANLFSNISGKAIQHECQGVDTDPPNFNKAAPVISSHIIGAADYNFIGNAEPNDTIEVFLNDSVAQHATRYIGKVVADGAGGWSISIPKDTINTFDDFVLIATATDGVGNTSELSAIYGFEFVPDDACTVKNTDDDGANSLRSAIQYANSGVCKYIEFDISPVSLDPDTIYLLSSLPDITNDGIFIDGSTETGYRVGYPAVVIDASSFPLVPVEVLADSFTFKGVRMHGSLSPAVVMSANIGSLVEIVVEGVRSAPGVFINGDSNYVYGSYFGIDADSNTVGNNNNAISINSSYNIIGSTSQPNIIYGSARDAISVSFENNTILYNTIYNSGTVFTTSNKAIVNSGFDKFIPVFDSAQVELGVATLYGRAEPLDTVQFFTNPGLDQWATGYIDQVIAGADSLWTFTVPAPYYDENQYANTYGATGTNTSATTSELSEVMAVVDYSGGCIVTNTEASGFGSLAQAVDDANAGFCDVINFDISPLSTQKDTIDARGYTFTRNGITVDGTTESGYTDYDPAVVLIAGVSQAFQIQAKNTTIRGIEMNGFLAQGGAIGLNADSCIIEYCAILNCSDGITTGGVLDESARGSVIRNNHFGMTANGVIGGNNKGIDITWDSITVIGNYFAGNNEALRVGDFSQYQQMYAVIEGNTFGTNINGVVEANTIGIYANSNLGAITITGNTIAHSTQDGILLSAVNNSVITDNIIHDNGGNGITLSGFPNYSDSVLISRNVFYANTDTAIELHGSSFQPANNDKTTPQIAFYKVVGANYEFSGFAQSGDIIELFLNDGTEQHATKYIGEGLTDAFGEWTVSVPQDSIITWGDTNVVATARDLGNNTSELSSPFNFVLPPSSCIVTTTDDAGVGSLREKVGFANLGFCPLITFDIPGVGPHTITLNSQLNIGNVDVEIRGDITEEVRIDGGNSTSIALTHEIGAQDDKTFILKNLTIQNFTSYGMIMGDVNALIENNYFNNCGTILRDRETGFHDVEIINNVFANSNIGFQFGTGQNHSLVIRDNYFGIDRDGIAVPLTQVGVSSFVGNLVDSAQIYDNVFANVPVGFGSDASLTNTKIYSNDFGLFNGQSVGGGTRAIQINSSSSNIVIGSLDTTLGNTINNYDVGIYLGGGAVVDNQILSNKFFNCDSMPIELTFFEGFSSNDSIQPPSITEADQNLTFTFSNREVDAIAYIQLYRTDSLPNNAYEILETFDQTAIQSIKSGTFTAAYFFDRDYDGFISAVVTDTAGNSSEFATPIRVKTYAYDETFCIVTNTQDQGKGSLREAVTAANLGYCPVITFDIPGAGPHTINLLSGLIVSNTEVTVLGPEAERVIIDGTLGPAFGTAFTAYPQDGSIDSVTSFRNLEFENFSTTLSLQAGSYWVDNCSFLDGSASIQVAGVDSFELSNSILGEVQSAVSVISADTNAISIHDNLFGVNEDSDSLPISNIAINVTSTVQGQIYNNTFVSSRVAVAIQFNAHEFEVYNNLFGYYKGVEMGGGASGVYSIWGNGGSDRNQIGHLDTTLANKFYNYNYPVDLEGTFSQVVEHTVLGNAYFNSIKPIDLNLVGPFASTNDSIQPPTITEEDQNISFTLPNREIDALAFVQLYRTDSLVKNAFEVLQTFATTEIQTLKSGASTLEYLFNEEYDGFISVIVTDTAGNTSEFSESLKLKTFALDDTYCEVISDFDSIGKGTLRTAVVAANNGFCPIVTFDISPDRIDTIQLLSSLPDQVSSYVIDGTTEPGYQIGSPQVIVMGDSDMSWDMNGSLTVNGIIFENFNSILRSSSSVGSVTFDDCEAYNVDSTAFALQGVTMFTARNSHFGSETKPVQNLLSIDIDNRITFENDTIYSTSSLPVVETYSGIGIIFKNNQITTVGNALELTSSNNSVLNDNHIISADSGFVVKNSSNLQVFRNHFDVVQNHGIVIDGGDFNWLRTNLIDSIVSATGLAIEETNNGNLEKAPPTIIKFDIYQRDFILTGTSAAYDYIELFDGSEHGGTCDTLLNTTTADSNGSWEIIMPLEDLVLDGANYLVATGRNTTNNRTSELSNMLTANLHACWVTKTTNAGDSTLRNAIDSVNVNACNIVLFDISPLSIEPDTIELSTPLPVVIGNNAIFNGAYETGFTEEEGSVIVTKGIGSGTVIDFVDPLGISIHGMTFAQGDTGIRMTNGSYNTIDYSGTYLNTQVGFDLEGSDYEVAHNSFVGSNTSTEVRFEGLNSNIDSNEFIGGGIGLELVNADSSFVRGNELLSASISGVYLNNTTRNYIEGNKVERSQVGFTIDQSNLDTVVLNEANFSNTYGYLINESDRLDFGLNYADSNQSYGIYIVNSDSVKVRGGASTRNLSGVVIDTGCVGTEVSSMRIGSDRWGSKPNIEYGIIIRSSGQIIGNGIYEGNYIENNPLGGVYVEKGSQNRILYNYIVDNDTSSTIPLTKGIDLNNGEGNNDNLSPRLIGYTKRQDTLYDIQGVASPGDSVHLYLNEGHSQNARTFAGSAIAAVDSSWMITIEEKELVQGTQNWAIGTATDPTNNTSEFSNIIPVGDCYVTNTEDNGSDEYPIRLSLRSAVKCVNLQIEHVGLIYSIPGTNQVINLESKLPGLINPAGVDWEGTTNVTVSGSAVEEGAWALKLTDTLGVSSLSNARWSGFDNGVLVEADTISMNVFRITGNDTVGMSGTYGILVNGESSFDTISNSVISGFEYGAYLDTNLTESTISELSVSSVDEGLHIAPNVNIDSIVQWSFSSTRKASIYIDANDSILLDSNIFTGVEHAAIWLHDCENIELKWNQVSGLDTSMRQFIPGDSVFAHAFLLTGDCANVSFDTNAVYGNSEGSGLSILSTTAHHVSALDNIFNLDGHATILKGRDHSFVSNVFVATGNGVLGDSLKNTQFIENEFLDFDSYPINLFSSDSIYMRGNRMPSFPSDTVGIQLHYGQSWVSNNGKPAPIIDTAGFFKDSCDTKFIITGIAEPMDTIEVWRSSNGYATLDSLIDLAYTDELGEWSFEVPESMFKKPEEGDYFFSATASDSSYRTSQISNLLYVPNYSDSIVVVNTNDAGAGSLRDAIANINCSEFFVKVKFGIAEEGPYEIVLDSLPYDTLYNPTGFIIDGLSQVSSGEGTGDQRIIVLSPQIDTVLEEAIVIADSNGVSEIHGLNFIGFDNGLKVQTDGNTFSHLGFVKERIDTTSSIVDTGVVIRGTSGNVFDSVYVEGYGLGMALVDSNLNTEVKRLIVLNAKVGLEVGSAVDELIVEHSTFGFIDSIGLHIRGSEGVNEYDTNTFGMYLDTVAGIVGYGVWLEDTKNQYVHSNQFDNIGYLTKSGGYSNAAILLSGSSSNNNVADNYLGETDTNLSDGVISIQGSGIVLDGSGAALAPASNFIQNNYISRTQEAAITMNVTDGNTITGNIIGLNSHGDTLIIGGSAIQIDSALSDVIDNNLILNYTDYGLDITSSQGVLVSQNNVYSSISTNKGINLNLLDADQVSNGGLLAPVIDSANIIDTSYIRLFGSNPSASTKIELFVGYGDNTQSYEFVGTEATIGTTWTYDVPRDFYNFRDSVRYVATVTDNISATSEFSEPIFIDDILCQLDTVNLFADTIQACPGSIVTLDAVIDGMNYLWTSDSLEQFLFTKYIHVSKEGVYNIEMGDGGSCVHSEDIFVDLYAGAAEPDFILPTDIFLGDTMAIIDIAEEWGDSVYWDWGGATVWLPDSTELDSTNNLTYYAIYPDSGAFTITQTFVHGECQVSLEKDVRIYDPVFWTGPGGQLPVSFDIDIDSLTLFESPVTDGSFSVRLVLNEPAVVSWEIRRVSTSAVVFSGVENDLLDRRTIQVSEDDVPLEDGVYVFVVRSPGDVSSVTFIVEKL